MGGDLPHEIVVCSYAGVTIPALGCSLRRGKRAGEEAKKRRKLMSHNVVRTDKQRKGDAL
jgi:hypothetical protein